jgi:hypothetical protein
LPSYQREREREKERERPDGDGGGEIGSALLAVGASLGAGESSTCWPTVEKIR